MDASLPSHGAGRRIVHPLVWTYHTIAFYGILALLGIVFLGWNLPAALFHRILPRQRSTRLGQLVIMRSFRTLLALMRLTGLARFDLSALDALRDQPGLVIAPNHPTLLDAVLVTSRLPRIVCITKTSVWDNPLLGSGARLAGYIRNDAPHHLVRRAADAVRQGCQLLIFPEGTRTRAPPLGAFKPGFALMARRAAAPVQTVFLETNSPFLGKGWPLLRRPTFPLAYRARLGRRFIVEGPAHPFCARLEAYMRAELDQG